MITIIIIISIIIIMMLMLFSMLCMYVYIYVVYAVLVVFTARRAFLSRLALRASSARECPHVFRTVGMLFDLYYRDGIPFKSINGLL